jgi:hypothetical protein
VVPQKSAGLGTKSVSETWKIVSTGKRDGQSSKPDLDEPQAVHAFLMGSDRCGAEGLSARTAAPTLALCRLLVEAGHNPNRPLHAYRGNVLCIIVGSIDEGARVTIEDDRHGRPRLRRWRERGPAKVERRGDGQ